MLPKWNLKWSVWHGMLAILLGACVFVTAELASWIHMRKPGVGSTAQRSTQLKLSVIDREIEGYLVQEKQLPQTLCDLRELWCNGNASQDDWGNPLHYLPQGGTFELYSLGRDAKPGGIGMDADLYIDGRTDEQATLPFSQFFFETPTQGNVVFCGILAVIAAVQYLSFQIQEGVDEKHAERNGIGLAIGIFVAATVIAYLVTPFHIPSGH